MSARAPLVVGADGLPQQVQSADTLIGYTKTIAQSAIPVSHTGDTSVFTFATVSIPGNTIGPSGTVEAYAVFSSTGSATRYGRILFGGTQYAQSSAAGTASFRINVAIENRGATNSQVGFPPIGTNANSVVAMTSSADTTAAVSVDFTGALTSSSDTLTLEMYYVRVTYGA